MESKFDNQGGSSEISNTGNNYQKKNNDGYPKKTYHKKHYNKGDYYQGKQSK